MESAVKVESGEARRGRPSKGAREALVAAARELFVERDYDQVSIDEILDRSGVSRGALYHHFPTKLDLFRAVWEASERRLIEELAAQVPVSASPFEMLVGLTRAYLRAATKDEEMRRIGLGQSRAVLGWEAWREASMGLGIGVALAVVSAAIEAGELPDEDPETMAIVVLGAVIEAAVLIATAEEPAAAHKRSEPVVLALLEGLRR
jgi:AcrR family transcriptional regulator